LGLVAPISIVVTPSGWLQDTGQQRGYSWWPWSVSGRWHRQL